METEIVNKLISYIESTENFMTEQAPIVIEEILRRPVIDLSFSILTAITLAVGIKTALYGLSKLKFEDDVEKYWALVIFWMACALPIVISTATISTDLYNVVLVHFIPRLYILEYLGGLV